jgi:hypothetical protein
MATTFAGQFVVEGFAQLKLLQWQRVFFTRLCALLPALLLTTLTANNPTATDSMGQVCLSYNAFLVYLTALCVVQWMNVLQSVALPFVLIPLVGFASSENVSGEHKIGVFYFTIACACVFSIVCINLYLLGTNVVGASSPLPQQWWMFLMEAIVAATYVWFLGSIAWEVYTLPKIVVPINTEDEESITSSSQSNKDGGAVCLRAPQDLPEKLVQHGICISSANETGSEKALEVQCNTDEYCKDCE